MKTQDEGRRGYSQTAANGEAVTPPAPRGTGFSFGQATPGPSTGGRGTGKRRWVGGCMGAQSRSLRLFLFFLFLLMLILRYDSTTKVLASLTRMCSIQCRTHHVFSEDIFKQLIHKHKAVNCKGCAPSFFLFFCIVLLEDGEIMQGNVYRDSHSASPLMLLTVFFSS